MYLLMYFIVSIDLIYCSNLYLQQLQSSITEFGRLRNDLNQKIKSK